jgi:hypothetical protein
MPLSLDWADRWTEARIRFARDAAYLADRAMATADHIRAAEQRGKAAGFVEALKHMDELERVNGPIA